MEPINPETSLAQLVTDHPELAREMERRGLDYCCGGARLLSEACAAVGLDPQTVAGELSLAAVHSPPAEWASMDVVALVDHVVDTHHRYLRAELPRLSALAATVHDVHGERHPELAAVAAVFAALRADLEPHMLKEEHVLFPMVRELATSPTTPTFHRGSLRNPISVMLREHDTVGDLLAELRRSTNDYLPPDDGSASYRALYEALEQLEADTHLHVHKENNLLFPMILALETTSLPA